MAAGNSIISFVFEKYIVLFLTRKYRSKKRNILKRYRYPENPYLRKDEFQDNWNFLYLNLFYFYIIFNENKKNIQKINYLLTLESMLKYRILIKWYKLRSWYICLFLDKIAFIHDNQEFSVDISKIYSFGLIKELELSNQLNVYNQVMGYYMYFTILDSLNINA